ncbi:apolipoprotein N-acyltransferase [Pauljensenia sp. UMB0018B]|uniref:Apolipoprotein N-acyltransferase n=1 Tax=Schaalia odontolytica TaxID=1660 RepID=A0A2I1I2Y0_9ACTO|nr:apolipoprotein N-acyltransferase [Schaalia odontolytica]MDK7339136.1 apolipoprotein N-acyltransferase [Pauljensenia sp. UMB0018B]PKY65453.1 apolipoprotein N-acyltransferase [Schaalia odontolytica]
MGHQEILRRVSFAHICGDSIIAAVAGLALYASFPPLGWWWLSVPALALYISRIDEARAPRALTVTFVFGMSFWIPLIDWIPLAVGTRPPWFVLAFVQTLFLMAWALFARWTQLWAWARGPIMQALFYALTWAGVDAARSRWPWSGFPWGSVALPQVDSSLGRLAPYGGTTLITVVVVFLAVLVRRACAARDASVVREHWFSRPALALIVAGAFIAPLAVTLPNQAENGMLRIGVVQGDIALPGAQAYSREGEVTDNNVRASLELASSPELAHDPIDLAIWGEGSVDRDPLAFPAIGQAVDRAATALDAPILIGYTNLNERDRVKNWLAVWDPGTGMDEAARYSKHVPVPFGEFIPFRDFIASFATEVAQSSKDMEAGEEPPLMTIEARDGRSVPLAVGICFEAAYPMVIGDGVARGGQAIIVPSNNYHFRSSGESAQQGQLLRMRAMEYSRSAVQASTTGHSYVIRPDGSILESTGTEQAATLAADIPLRSSLTVTAWAGERVPGAVMAATFVINALALVTVIGQGIRASARARRASSH